MNWEKGIVLGDDERWRTETDFGPLNLSYELGSFQGVLEYTRPPLETLGEDEPHEETFMFEGAPDRITVDFLPLYPLRPIVFELEETLKVPPGERGFFCVRFQLAIGITIRRTDTIIERLLNQERKKSYWGPPNNGLSTFRERSPVHTDTMAVVTETSTTTAVLPVYYSNHREEGEEVTHCLAPLDELDLYRNEDDDLIYEVIRLNHRDEFYQEPSPQKRTPREMKQHVSHFLKGPGEPKSLFDRVRSLPRLTGIGSLFLNR